MAKKTDIVREAIRSRDFKKALRIAKDFQINVTEDQRYFMSLAYECMLYPDFYSQIGYDLQEYIERGIKVVESLFGPKARKIG